MASQYKGPVFARDWGIRTNCDTGTGADAAEGAHGGLDIIIADAADGVLNLGGIAADGLEVCWVWLSAVELLVYATRPRLRETVLDGCEKTGGRSCCCCEAGREGENGEDDGRLGEHFGGWRLLDVWFLVLWLV